MSLRRLSLPYVEDPASRLEPLKELPWFVFLDSCAARATGGRFDLIAADPVATVETRGAVTSVTAAGRAVVSDEDPFTVLAQALCQHLPPTGDHALFDGGAIGYFAYDLARRIEPLPARAARDIDLPDMAVGLYGWAIVVDHEARSAELVIHPAASCDVEFVTHAWGRHPALTPPAFASSFEVISRVRPELDFDQYARSWHRIKQYLREGDAYQVNLTQRFSASVRGDAWDAYQWLRLLNPAPFSAYLDLPDGQVLSSSPERFLRVRDGVVETRPIKGTRPRGADATEDARLRRELEESLKDRAENVMIVDLLRNDLGKRALTGSVEVPALFAVESYTKVHHLVSTVRARVAEGTSPLTVLRDCFPGGSITGAPKLRAMEIIEELEPQRRSVYCGAIGYVSASGRMDTNIAIRTLVCHRGRMYCWAGGGIVMDSGLDAEYAESLAKASAMLDVFANAEREGVDHQDRR